MGVGGEGVDLHAERWVPNLHGSVVVARDQQPPVGREGERGNASTGSVQVTEWDPVRHLPHNERPVRATGRESPAVRRKDPGNNGLRMGDLELPVSFGRQIKESKSPRIAA